jgi:1-phosphatidylinositol phosphodiesterase
MAFLVESAHRFGQIVKRECECHHTVPSLYGKASNKLFSCLSFQYELRGSHQVVQTQDWYDIGSLSAIPDKVALIKQLCQESGSNGQVLSLNYCNGSSFPFALPPAVAKGFLDDGTMMGEEKSSLMRLLAREGVNSQVRDFVANVLFSNVSPLPRQGAVDELKIVWALDYYNEPKGAADLVPILIEANF